MMLRCGRAGTLVRAGLLGSWFTATLLALITPASAHEAHHPQRHHQRCVDGRLPANLLVRVSPDGTSVTVRGRKPLCHPVVLLWASYSVPATWDRVRFDASAVP